MNLGLLYAKHSFSQLSYISFSKNCFNHFGIIFCFSNPKEIINIVEWSCSKISTHRLNTPLLHSKMSINTYSIMLSDFQKKLKILYILQFYIPSAENSREWVVSSSNSQDIIILLFIFPSHALRRKQSIIYMHFQKTALML